VEWPCLSGAKQKRTGQQAGELVSGSRPSTIRHSPSARKFQEMSRVMPWLWSGSSASAGADYQAVTVFKSDLRNGKV